MSKGTLNHQSSSINEFSVTLEHFLTFNGTETIIGQIKIAMLFDKGVNGFEKSFDPCQPAQSVQADMGRNCSLSIPFPKRQTLDPSKLKEFADDNFKFDENGRRSSKRVENTVGKRRNCPLRAISPFPTVFSKDL